MPTAKSDDAPRFVSLISQSSPRATVTAEEALSDWRIDGDRDLRRTASCPGGPSGAAGVPGTAGSARDDGPPGETGSAAGTAGRAGTSWSTGTGSD